jgi:uncharacterized protein
MRVLPLEIVVGGQTIRGNLYSPAEISDKPALLFIHGWTGKPPEEVAAMAAERGYYALTFSLRGHNESDGDIHVVTRAGALADAGAAYDFLQSQVGDVPVVVVGGSYGGYTAALLSGNRNVAGLSLRVPAGYPDEGFDEPQFGKDHNDASVMEWRSNIQGHNSNKAFGAVYAFAGPVQIIEAGKDELVPHQTVLNYADSVADKDRLEYHLMPDWPHSLGGDPTRIREFQDVLFGWLAAKF